MSVAVSSVLWSQTGHQQHRAVQLTRRTATAAALRGLPDHDDLRLIARLIPFNLGLNEGMVSVPNDKKKVSIQYRKLDDQEGYFGQMSLQDALAQAMKHQKEDQQGPVGARPENRFQNEDPAYGTVFLNAYDAPSTHFFGEIVRFEEGAQLTMLHLAPGGQSFNLVQASAGKDHEALKGILYFMVFRNHVTLLAGEINPSRLESYLRWILTQLTDTLTKAASVVLEARINVAEGSTQLASAEAVTVHPTPLVSTDQRQDAMDPHLIGETMRVSGMNTIDVLKAAGLDDADIASFINERTDIQVKVEITFKSGYRRKSISSERIGRMFRNVEPNDLGLSSKVAGQQKGGLVKLTWPTEIRTVGSLLDTKDVARALLEAYRFFQKNGHISA